MSDWIRCSKTTPCPRCGRDNWCQVSADGAVCICMRDSSGHPKTFKDGSQGWIHRLTGETRTAIQYHKPKPKVEIDAEGMMERWVKSTQAYRISDLAKNLGVSASALMELRAAWAPEHNAYAFSMRDDSGKIVGIRLRSLAGDKWSVRGSKQGIFLPWRESDVTAYVVEGPTDAAAGLTLNLFTVGRPSCSGGLYDLKAAFQRLNVRRVVIIADNDEDKYAGERKFNPGIDGAASLARTVAIPCCVVTLPCKDLRSFLNNGGDLEMLESITKNFVWENINEKVQI